MKQGNNSVIKITNITSELLGNRLSRILRNHIGKGLRFSYCDASLILDVDKRTVESWVKGERTPNMEGFFRLCCLPEVGPLVAAEMFALIQLSVTEIIPEDASPHEVNSWLATTLADLSKKLEDGILDHTEEPEFIPLAMETSAKLAGWCASRVSKKEAAQ